MLSIKRFTRSCAIAILSTVCSFAVAETKSILKPYKQYAPRATVEEAQLSFRDLPHLDTAFIDTSPADLKDGIAVGELGGDGGNKEMIIGLADEIAEGKHGKFDSMLIVYKNKLVFESYFLRGRIDLPHPQASATKAYTALTVGRAIQLGHLSMADLDKPLISFMDELDTSKLVSGADKITLHKAMTMRSGIRLTDEKHEALRDNADNLKGQQQVQAYLEQSAPISDASQSFKYQMDPLLVMHVIDAVVPGSAMHFIESELLNKLDIKTYGWRMDKSGLPVAGSRSSLTSRAMVKLGTLTINKGRWKGEQLIPQAYIAKATERLVFTGDEDVHFGGKDVSNQGYGYYWWGTDLHVNNKRYVAKSAQGGGGQLIVLIEELDLMVVITGHDNNAAYQQVIAERILPAFIE